VNTAHLEYETLADLAEGLLDDEPAAAATAHLEQCAECRDRSAELVEVSRLLAEVPVPPMPAELAGRIDAAIAAEAAATSDVTSLTSRRERRHLRVLSAAAAGVLVVGGGAMLARTAMNSPISSEASKAQSPAQPAQERNDRAVTSGADRASPNAAPSAPSAPSAPESQIRSAAEEYAIATSGTDYRAATLGSQVAAELRRNHVMSHPAGTSAQRLTGCVHRVAANQRPLLVDVAEYEGRPATIIALPGDRADRLDVWIVGPSCSATAPDVIEHAQTTR
jgi:anti-sigma factor RsiW